MQFLRLPGACLALILAFLLAPGTKAAAQNGTFVNPVAPEQFPCGAITVCADSFATKKAYFFLEEWPPSYTHWLKVEIATSGKLLFMIKPRLASDNYDFTIYKGNNLPCGEVPASPVLRRNTTPGSAAYNQGRTGLLGVSNEEITYMSQYCKPVDVVAGDVYYIAIDGYGQVDPASMAPFIRYYAPEGYTIDFTASTCSFVTGAPVQLDSVAYKCNNYSEILIYLTKPVKVSSIAINASDFEMTPSPTSPYMATPVGGDEYTNIIKLELAPQLPPGNYTLRAKTGTDGNTFIDMCGVELPLPDAVPFKVPRLDSTINLKVCPQQMPYTWNGITIPNPGMGVATVTQPNEIGCDSVAKLNLAIVDTMRDTVNLQVCPSEMPYTWHGITVTAPGNNAATYMTTAAGGCDSAVTLNLSLLLPQQKDIDLSACGPLSFEGHTYNASQIIEDTVKSFRGCDSLYRTLHITIHPAITPQHISQTEQGCGYVRYNGQVYVNSTQLKDTLYNQYGCDSVYRTTNILVYPGVQPLKAADTVSGCSSVVFGGQTYTRDTTIVTLLSSVAGCDSVRLSTSIIVRELNLELTADPEQPVKGDEVTLRTTAPEPYQVLSWEPQSLFPDQHALQQRFFIRQDEVFRVIAMSDLGCIDTAELKLRADSLVPVALMPNAFSPNGDGLNDEFKPFFVNKSGYIVRRFFIYNRWGREVYHAYNQKNASWNGLYGNTGKPADPGTYFYTIDIEFLDKTKASFKGEVNLIY